MALRFFRRSSLLLVALCLGPSLAHLFEMPNKLALGRDDYLTVQQIYRGWALLGIVVMSAIASTLILTILERRNRVEFRLALGAFICLIVAQILFWGFTFPANEATANWTVLPPAWTALRNQWEYSHAAGAVLNLTAFCLLLAGATRQT